MQSLKKILLLVMAAAAVHAFAAEEDDGTFTISIQGPEQTAVTSSGSSASRTRSTQSRRASAARVSTAATQSSSTTSTAATSTTTSAASTAATTSASDTAASSATTSTTTTAAASTTTASDTATPTTAASSTTATPAAASDTATQTATSSTTATTAAASSDADNTAATTSATTATADTRNLRHYTVKAGDTLWSVSNQFVPDDHAVNEFQVAASIYRNNPKSFGNGNVNNLYAGDIVIPDNSEIARESTEAGSALLKNGKADLPALAPVAANNTSDINFVSTSQAEKIIKRAEGNPTYKATETLIREIQENMEKERIAKEDEEIAAASAQAAKAAAAAIAPGANPEESLKEMSQEKLDMQAMRLMIDETKKAMDVKTRNLDKILGDLLSRMNKENAATAKHATEEVARLAALYDSTIADIQRNITELRSITSKLSRENDRMRSMLLANDEKIDELQMKIMDTGMEEQHTDYMQPVKFIVLGVGLLTFMLMTVFVFFKFKNRARNKSITDDLSDEDSGEFGMEDTLLTASLGGGGGDSQNSMAAAPAAPQAVQPPEAPAAQGAAPFQVAPEQPPAAETQAAPSPEPVQPAPEESKAAPKEPEPKPEPAPKPAPKPAAPRPTPEAPKAAAPARPAAAPAAAKAPAASTAPQANEDLLKAFTESSNEPEPAVEPEAPEDTAPETPAPSPVDKAAEAAASVVKSAVNSADQLTEDAKAKADKLKIDNLAKEAQEVWDQAAITPAEAAANKPAGGSSTINKEPQGIWDQPTLSGSSHNVRTSASRARNATKPAAKKQDDMEAWAMTFENESTKGKQVKVDTVPDLEPDDPWAELLADNNDLAAPEVIDSDSKAKKAINIDEDAGDTDSEWQSAIQGHDEAPIEDEEETNGKKKNKKNKLQDDEDEDDSSAEARSLGAAIKKSRFFPKDEAPAEDSQATAGAKIAAENAAEEENPADSVIAPASAAKAMKEAAPEVPPELEAAFFSARADQMPKASAQKAADASQVPAGVAAVSESESETPDTAAQNLTGPAAAAESVAAAPFELQEAFRSATSDNELADFLEKAADVSTDQAGGGSEPEPAFVPGTAEGTPADTGAKADKVELTAPTGTDAAAAADAASDKPDTDTSSSQIDADLAPAQKLTPDEKDFIEKADQSLKAAVDADRAAAEKLSSDEKDFIERAGHSLKVAVEAHRAAAEKLTPDEKAFIEKADLSVKRAQEADLAAAAKLTPDEKDFIERAGNSLKVAKEADRAAAATLTPDEKSFIEKADLSAKAALEADQAAAQTLSPDEKTFIEKADPIVKAVEAADRAASAKLTPDEKDFIERAGNSLQVAKEADREAAAKLTPDEKTFISNADQSIKAALEADRAASAKLTPLEKDFIETAAGTPAAGLGGAATSDDYVPSPAELYDYGENSEAARAASGGHTPQAGASEESTPSPAELYDYADTAMAASSEAGREGSPAPGADFGSLLSESPLKSTREQAPDTPDAREISEDERDLANAMQAHLHGNTADHAAPQSEAALSEVSAEDATAAEPAASAAAADYPAGTSSAVSAASSMDSAVDWTQNVEPEVSHETPAGGNAFAEQHTAAIAGDFPGPSSAETLQDSAFGTATDRAQTTAMLQPDSSLLQEGTASAFGTETGETAAGTFDSTAAADQPWIEPGRLQGSEHTRITRDPFAMPEDRGDTVVQWKIPEEDDSFDITAGHEKTAAAEDAGAAAAKHNGAQGAQGAQGAPEAAEQSILDMLGGGANPSPDYELPSAAGRTSDDISENDLKSMLSASGTGAAPADENLLPQRAQRTARRNRNFGAIGTDDRGYGPRYGASISGWHEDYGRNNRSGVQSTARYGKSIAGNYLTEAQHQAYESDLNLARLQFETGEFDEARNIIANVMDKGSEDLIEQAQALIDEYDKL